MTVGGRIYSSTFTNEVEVVSTDPVRYPVPGCVQSSMQYPGRNAGSMGAAVQNGEVGSTYPSNTEVSSSKVV